MNVSNERPRIYEPDSDEPFDEETSELMTSVLKFSMDMARNREELMDFYQAPMNRNHFHRVSEEGKMILRKEWKRIMDSFKIEEDERG